LLHYGQDIITGKFKQFDYGNDKDNRAKYGTKIPPMIDLNGISKNIPIYLIAGEEDDLADKTDVEWLENTLGDRIKKTTFIPKFDHGGYSTGNYSGWIPNALSHIAKPGNI